jgi:hypothetical protein
MPSSPGWTKKSQIQALQRAQPILPWDIGQPERRTNHVRHGTVDLFAALNVATGEVLTRLQGPASGLELRRVSA